MTQPPKHVKEEKHADTEVRPPNRQDLRRSLRQQRNAIEPAVKTRWDQAIGDRLTKTLHSLAPVCLAVYWPIQSEPNLIECFESLHHQGIQLALPIVTAKAQPLIFVPWIPGQAMENDPYGIPIPVLRDTQLTPDCILAPCVGFNKLNYRLGYGGGFYDRTLAVHRQARSIGIAYELNKADFSADTFDLPLSLILTEASTYEKSESVYENHS